MPAPLEGRQSEHVPILIVGGSLVGLSTAMFLAHQGIPSLTVERHAGTAIHPRAGHFQLRTLELLRLVGLEDEVRRMFEERFFPNGGATGVGPLPGPGMAPPIPRPNEWRREFRPS